MLPKNCQCRWHVWFPEQTAENVPTQVVPPASWISGILSLLNNYRTKILTNKPIVFFFLILSVMLKLLTWAKCSTYYSHGPCAQTITLVGLVLKLCILNYYSLGPSAQTMTLVGLVLKLSILNLNLYMIDNFIEQIHL